MSNPPGSCFGHETQLLQSVPSHHLLHPSCQGPCAVPDCDPGIWQRCTKCHHTSPEQVQHLLYLITSRVYHSPSDSFCNRPSDAIHGQGATCRPGLTPAAGTPGAQVLNQPPSKDDHRQDQDEHSDDHSRHISSMVRMHRPSCHGIACIVWAERCSENASCVVESGPAL